MRTFFRRELPSEIMAAFIFVIISFIYLIIKHSPEEIIDNLFKWMFPTSVTVFLTLIIVKLIEAWRERKIKKYKYVVYKE